MQKCLYHAKTDAVTTCIGCKMPVCQTCKNEGKNGFCDACIKKTASLSERVSEGRKTGSLDQQKVTTLRTPGQKSATGCFDHVEHVASGACMACKRPFCPACLNEQLLCPHCVQQAATAAARPPMSRERSQALAKSGVSVGTAATAGGTNKKDAAGGRKKWLIGGVLGVAVLVGALALTRHPGTPPKSAADNPLKKLKDNELTAQEKALLHQLNQSAGNASSIEDAQAPGADNGDQPSAYGETGGHAKAVQPARSLNIGVAAPRSGAVLSGLATIRAQVSGRPERVELLVDGQWQGAIDSPPYHFDWASQAVGNGRHRVTLEAIGSDGRKRSSSITVTVKN